VKDVSWGDFLVAMVLAPFLSLPVIGSVYFVLFGILDVDSDFVSSYWLSITFVATCVAEGLILAAMCGDEEQPIEHGWAWLAAVAIIAAVALIPYAAGVITKDYAIGIMHMLYADVAMVFLLVMLSVFINARRNRPNLIEVDKVEAL